MVNKLRQKVTSKLRACSRWRVTTPAVDHIRVTATIRTRPGCGVSFKGCQTCEPLAAGALALALGQVALAQANRLGRDFDQLVVFDELHTVFQRATQSAA